ncbi:MAG TPA: site-2 protease family protein [Thermoanaerobaculia bacterium]|nr:site-2 protease family protein [Thermoanaerobaculia bacterium]
MLVVTFLTTTTLGGLFALDARPADLPPLAVDSGDAGDFALLVDPALARQVWSDPWLRGWGLRFAMATLFILLCHEMGHWLACRRHRLPATPPYFLPAPVGLGTFGAFIRIRAPIRRKRELLDVGVAGPIAGFVALLPVLWLGIVRAVPIPIEQLLAERGPGLRLLFGGNLLLRGALALAHPGLGAEMSVPMNPWLLAAWVGMFATMLNLLPLAQLDGGHILYAATGRLHRRLAWPVWGALLLLGMLWSGWWLWCVVVLVLGLRHPPVADERAPLAARDRWLVLAALVLFVLCFMPIPLQILEVRPV